MGYRAVDVCGEDQDFDDFQDGLCDPPGGGLINGITEVDSFAFQVPFTDQDRQLFIGNNAYMIQDWMLDWYVNCPWCKEQHQSREDIMMRQPSPMLGQDAIDFIDSTDTEGNKVFETLNVDWATIYEEDPDFIVPATNKDTLKTFIEYKWSTNADVDWSYKPAPAFNQEWPLPEDLAYNNATYQTAAIGGFPLGDLNWFPDQLADWEAQRDAEWETINNWLEYGSPEGPNRVEMLDAARPRDYKLGQNYPNPFNPVTRIKYSIPKAGYVSLKVYNNIGQQVATLYEGNQIAGQYIATFDGSDLSSGIYFYTLQSDNISLTKKLILMK
ncbi:MAG: T9SS type A sorting domain-containing protein [candidate division KSB1 bacterium]|nr:T9SS type A sorting domain-containing protein [candidate division KSB1 bacterium]